MRVCEFASLRVCEFASLRVYKKVNKKAASQVINITRLAALFVLNVLLISYLFI